MCEPLTIAASAAVIGTGASIYGQVKAGKAAKKNAEAEAASIQRQAAYEAGEIKDAFERYLGRQGSNVAKAGRVMAGSALDLIADSAIDAEKQIQAVKSGAEQQASATRAAGKRAKNIAYWNAAATGIQGVSSFLSMTNSWGGGGGSAPMSAASGTSTGRVAGPV
jgi:hypothetical protein